MVQRLLAIGLLLWAAGCGGGQTSPGNSRIAGTRGKLVIAVIPKGTTHEFWKSVHAGALKAARDLGVEIIWEGPLSEANREAQIGLVENFVSRKVDGICLAPLDSQALIGPVRKARREGIPVLIFDSGLDETGDILSFVATDNYAGGALAARHLGKVMGGKGQVIVLRYTPGSQSTELRERGCLETLAKEFPDIKIISENEFAGASSDTALDKSQQLLTRFGGQVTGVFTPCQHVSSGMLRALAERDLAGKVKFVGFDAGPDLLQALKDGRMHGIVLQDPVRMAYLAVESMVRHLRGEKVAARIPTGETLATLETLNDAKIAALLAPEQAD